MSEPQVPCVKPMNQTKEDGVLATWSPEVFMTGNGFRSSLPCESQEDRLQIYKLCESDCRPGKEMINQTFLVSDYVCYLTDLNGKDGEIVQAVRTVLFCPGDRPVAFVAKSAFDFVKRTARHQPGEPAWNPPLKVGLRLVGTKGGNQVYKFDYDLPKRRK